jgi:hypothetical protein
MLAKIRNNLFIDLYCCFCISVYLTNANGSPVIQTLLLVLHKVDLDLCQRVIHKVIKATRIEDTAESVKYAKRKYYNFSNFKFAFFINFLISLYVFKVTNMPCKFTSIIYQEKVTLLNLSYIFFSVNST